MPDDPRVQLLIDELLESHSTPEEVCRSCVELVTVVRERWRQICNTRAELDAIFPPMLPPAASLPKSPMGDTALPVIPGYEVEAVLGLGGMGVVFRARHLRLNRIVALKMASAGAYAGAHERERFQREAEAVAGLRHANIVQIYDVGDSAGQPYFTMEFVEGGTLAQKLTGTPLPAHEAAQLLATLAGAVQAAHAGGIVHRDLKPANVLLTAPPAGEGLPAGGQFSFGTPKISDFGLARRLGGEAGLTRAGIVIGTPSYMAPEQARGSAGVAGPAADVYALGAILYELLTGRPPFRAETAADTVLQVISQDPVPPSQLNGKVPRDSEAICLKCLEKDPRKRYATAGELAADLGRFARGEPILARPPGRPERVRHWVRRHKGLATAFAGVALGLIAITLGSVVAAAHFRQLEGEQRVLAIERGRLADENGRLAAEKEAARANAVLAERGEAGLRQRAEAQGEELRRNLYIAQMNLAGQASSSPGGIGRVGEGLAAWEDNRPDLRGWEWYYLLSLCHRDSATLRGHAEGVQDVAWSPDGRRLASAGGDWTICLREGAGHSVSVLRGHGHLVAAVAWSPDSRRLASASWDATIKVWDTINGKELFTVQGHAGGVLAVAWSADGRRLASGGSDRTVRIWDAADGSPLHVLRGHDQPVAGIAWKPDGKKLASAGRDATVRIWDTVAGKEEHKLSGHTNWIKSVAWSPDGRQLASASNDQTVKVWDPAAGKELVTLRGHAEGVQSVAWSPDGTRLATSSDDQTVKIWEAKGGPAVHTLRGHTAPVPAVAWHPEGTRLASAGMDGTVKLWNATSSPEIIPLTGHTGVINAAAWSRAATPLLASASSDGTLRIWDVPRRRSRATLRGHDGEVRSVSWNPAGTRLASGGNDGTIRLWEPAGKEVALLRGHAGPVLAVSWSPDGRLLASAGKDGVVRLWDAEGGAEVHTCRAHRHWVHALTWSPDGTRLASASGDQTVTVWDVATGRDKLTIRVHSGGVTSVAWSPDGRWLASASLDQTVKITDATDGKAVQTLRGHTARVNSVAWHPDGTRLASASNDRSIKIWDFATGREALSLGENPVQVTAVAWSPDGITLISAGVDPAILVRDAAAGYVAASSPICLPVLDRRIASDQKDPLSWRERARAHAGLGDWDKAAADLRRYLALSPDQGWVTLGCWVAGPYPDDLRAQCLPERHLDPTHPTAQDASSPSRRIWKAVPLDDYGFTDFGPLCKHAEHVSAYAMLRVYSPERQQVALLLGSDDQSRLWLNGVQLHERVLTGRAEPDADAVPATLEAGWNSIVTRVVNRTGEHALYLRISDAPKDVRRALGRSGRNVPAP